jgi:acetyl esterase/lipase
VVIYIHGGETLLGTRRLDDGSADAPYFEKLQRDLIDHGFAVAAIDYRLAPLHHTSDQVHDAVCAVNFLRANAAALAVDPNRVGVIGPSQGGYISAMLGLASGPGEVQAVVDMWGPADLSDFTGSPKWVSALTGVGADPSVEILARLKAASPLYHVSGQAPPFLIIHGEDDWFIAPHHSRDLYGRLKEAGANVTYIAVAHSGHGLAAATRGKREEPAPDALIADIEAFFGRTLGQAG